MTEVRHRNRRGRKVYTLEQATEGFWRRVARGSPSECWPWIGRSVQQGGYGVLSYQYKRISSHRFAMMLALGRMPEGVVMHLCDNPPCCNPAHLRVGTQRENMRDMAAKGRQREQSKTHCKHGHPFNERNTTT